MGGTQTKGNTVSDRSALTLRFKADGMSDDLLKAIISAIGFDPDDQYTMRDAREGELMDEETALGTDDDWFTALLDLIENGREDRDSGEMIPVQDFPFATLQDPKYEYNGTLRKHTPGLPDYVAAASASWEPILPVDYWTTTIEHAPDLDTLRRQVRTALGLDHAL
jgi:hypothetical protein